MLSRVKAIRILTYLLVGYKLIKLLWKTVYLYTPKAKYIPHEPIILLLGICPKIKKCPSAGKRKKHSKVIEWRENASYNEEYTAIILYNNKKQQIVITSYKMKELHSQCWGGGSQTQEYILYSSIHMLSKNRANLSVRIY